MNKEQIDATALKVAEEAGISNPSTFLMLARDFLAEVAAEARPVAWVGLVSGGRYIHWGSSKPDFPAISKVRALFLHPAAETPAATAQFDDWPEYHSEAMGCGLEDRGITDRYEAMRYGWDQALEHVAERLPEFPSPTIAAAEAPAIPEGWQPIDTALNGKNGYAWMRLKWGPEGDPNTGDGMRYGDKFFAAATFHCPGQERRYQMREIEVFPTHWMHAPSAQNGESK